MELNRIEERLSKLVALVKQWRESGVVSNIERDLALEELRRVYDELLDNTQPHVEVEEEAISDAEVSVVAPSAGEIFDEALDIDALLGLTDDEPEPNEPEPTTASEPELAPIAEPEPIPEPEPAPTPTSEPAPAVEQPTVARGVGLFDIDEIPVRNKHGRKMISLYGATAAMPESRVVEPQPKSQTTPTFEPQIEQPRTQHVEPPQRLADVLGGGVTVLGDKMAAEEPTAPFNRITDLHKAIGLNDKFLMVRDLFGGDADKYEDTINTLNEFDDLDECMIYIVENFAWNPDNEGAKLLVSLIERKLS